MPNVFIALQKSEESRCIVEALMQDNPHANVVDQPAMLKIDALNSLVLKRATVEEKIGRTFDLRELHVYLITLAGNIDETDEELTLSWAH
ncbi:MAG: MmoB/DmpM family protein [Herbaspirillum sp.]